MTAIAFATQSFQAGKLALLPAVLMAGAALPARAGDLPVGNLGHPIGQLLFIEGMRADGMKTGIQTLTADKINGQALPAPIDIWIDNVDLPKGEHCAIRGYETIRTIGTPPAYEQLANLNGQPPPNKPQFGWQISDYFVALDAVEPNSLKIRHPDEATVAAPETEMAYDSYEAALIADLCAIAETGDHIDGELDHLKAILERHPNLVNARRVFRQARKPSFEDDFPPLQIAARHGDELVVALLLEKGADVNSTAAGWNALHIAAQQGYLPIVKLLVEHGADVNAKTPPIPQRSSDDFPGRPAAIPGEALRPPTIFPAVPARTALDLAREEKHADVVEFLQPLTKQ